VLKGIGFAPSYPRTDRQTRPLPWKWKEEKRDFDLFILKIFKKKLKKFHSHALRYFRSYSSLVRPHFESNDHIMRYILSSS